MDAASGDSDKRGKSDDDSDASASKRRLFGSGPRGTTAGRGQRLLREREGYFFLQT